MTKFVDLERLYHQFYNLFAEVDDLFESEDYDGANERLKHAGVILDKILLANKTAELDEEEKLKLSELDNSLKEFYLVKLTSYEKMNKEVMEELRKVNAKVKVSSAYDGYKETNEGSIIDCTE